MRFFLPIFFITSAGLLLCACGERQNTENHSHFTKTDSLTDIYLSLQDSIHRHWNMMINDDNHKLNSMHSLLHELMVTHPEGIEQYAKFEERLEQLSRMRYTPKSMANEHVVEEYDFASNSLVVEVIAATESLKEYSYNATLQKLVDHILTADENALYYRMTYDSLVYQFNAFVEKNKDDLQESESPLQLEKKPLFQMTKVDD